MRLRLRRLAAQWPKIKNHSRACVCTVTRVCAGSPCVHFGRVRAKGASACFPSSFYERTYHVSVHDVITWTRYRFRSTRIRKNQPGEIREIINIFPTSGVCSFLNTYVFFVIVSPLDSLSSIQNDLFGNFVFYFFFFFLHSDTRPLFDNNNCKCIRLSTVENY